MPVERKTTEQRATEKPGNVEHLRATTPSAQGASRSHAGFSPDDTPAVRLNDDPAGAGQSPGRGGPPTSLPGRASAVPPSPRPAVPAAPAFNVTASITGTTGPNAVLTSE